jgi:hypothetical protein
MTEKPSRTRKSETPQSSQPNEGEGNRTAARAFDADERKVVDSGQVEQKAREAEEALERKEGDELRRAKQTGKSRSKGKEPKPKH